MNKIVKRILLIIIILALAGGAFLAFSEIYVKSSTKDRVLTLDEAAKLENVDAIIVLGCLVHPSGRPSDMLFDRVKVGSELFTKGASEILFMSGDHLNEDYDEVGKMRELAVENGVPPEKIGLDGYGLSTYDTMWRAKNVYGFSRVIVVTQDFHLNRAVFDAKAVGLDAYGVAADLRGYGVMYLNNLREMLARCKDLVYTRFDPDPRIKEAYPGE